MGRRIVLLVSTLCLGILAYTPITSAAEWTVDDERALYDKMEALTHIPWHAWAAMDQYERNVRAVRKDLPKAERIGVYFTDAEWSGYANNQQADTVPWRIELFEGVGQDGDNDGKADREDPEDVLYTLSKQIVPFGYSASHIKEALWRRYQRDQSVRSIHAMSMIYQKMGTHQLIERHFPLPLSSHYSYRSTWGAKRGFGGLRIHEGTDLFASYGTPVMATTYGVVEMKGWNRYGGWRLGIRDANNVYHYFAHLQGFSEDIDIGTIVTPGQQIGSVGSSGYGPPGTQGKFPPHLHYGMYKDNGFTEFSFDPFPSLRVWERQTRAKRK
nr:M23 family metallopeptidase [Aureibacillus halotolerans]